MLVDDGRLTAFASGFEVVLPIGWVELDTGLRFPLLFLLNGVEVVRLLVVELGAEDELAADELGLPESSFGWLESLVVEFWSVDEACWVLDIFGIVYLILGVDDPRPRILFVSDLLLELWPATAVDDERVVAAADAEELAAVVLAIGDDEFEVDVELEAEFNLVLVTVNFKLPKLPCFIAN